MRVSISAARLQSLSLRMFRLHERGPREVGVMFRLVILRHRCGARGSLPVSASSPRVCVIRAQKIKTTFPAETSSRSGQLPAPHCPNSKQKSAPRVPYRNEREETLLTQGRRPLRRFVLPASCTLRRRGMRLTAAEGGLQTPRRKPGSFLLFVGFYVRLWLEHRRAESRSARNEVVNCVPEPDSGRCAPKISSQSSS